MFASHSSRARVDRLPIRPHTAMPERVRQRTDARDSLHDDASMNISALLIADERADICIVRDSLADSRAGSSHVEYAGSLGEGLLRLSLGSIDIVLLDLSLPDSEGSHTLAAVRRAHPAVPVLVIASDRRDGQAPSAVLGAPRFILQDRVDCHRLVDIVRNMVGRALRRGPAVGPRGAAVPT